jgi:tetratricopeptide (TPR) repeat protein
MSDLESVVWETSYPQALERARRERKLLVVHFMSPERPVCKAMYDETLSSPDVVRALRTHFVSLELDSRESEDLFEKLIGGKGLLATAIVDTREEVVSVLPGFADAPTFLRFLELARSGFGRILDLRAQLRREPRSVPIGLALAEAYDAMGSPKRAEDEYARVVTLIGAMPKAQASNAALVICRERLARLLLAKGQTAGARTELDRALELDPSRSHRPDRLLLTEALVLSAERRLSGAADRLNDLIAHFGSSPECQQALFVLGSLEHELGDDAGALHHLERLLREYPTSCWCSPATQQMVHIRSPQGDHRH